MTWIRESSPWVKSQDEMHLEVSRNQLTMVAIATIRDKPLPTEHHLQNVKNAPSSKLEEQESLTLQTILRLRPLPDSSHDYGLQNATFHFRK